jgi:hypothetical protein
MTKLFLAWQDGVSRRWYTIGRLTSQGEKYRFEYTNGVLEAQKEAGFEPLRSFPNLYEVYHSDELFPLFSNRLLSPSRPDYKDFIQWLSLAQHENDPMALLARSGGRRKTDTLEVFPSPENDGTGQYQIHFFVHGLGHATPESIKRAESLERGERLLLMHDFQNPVEPRALSLRTAETKPGDMYLLGYCPRYLIDDIHKLIREGNDLPVVTVERVNRPPAPIQFRLLCRMTMAWAADFKPFSDYSYQPLQAKDEASRSLIDVKRPGMNVDEVLTT